MKKLNYIFLIMATMSCYLVQSQTIFSENFNSSSSMPAGFLLVDNDGKTPASSVSYVNNAWVVRNESSSSSNKVAVSTSWYNPAAQSDDWMITPPITLTSNNLLKWRARAVDASYPDGYQVLLSPTGDTALASFTELLFSVNAENPEWTDRGISLISYAGQTVRIAFRNNSNDMYLLQVDDIQVIEYNIFYNAQMLRMNNYRYYQQGNVNLSATFKNLGHNTINSIQVHWTYDGVNINTSTLTGLNVTPFSEYTFNHPIPLSMSGPNKYPIKIWTSDINGNPDQEPTNDTASYNIYSVSSKPAKKTLLEQGTGAWCQFCPDGTVRFFQVMNSNPNVVGYTVHDGDAMATPQTDSINVLATGFPTGYIDRFKFLNQPEIGISRNQWSSYCSTRNNMAVPFGLSMNHSYNAWDRTVTVTLSAESKINANDRNYRFGIVVVQDSMSGTGTGWDQANYYNTVSGHPFYGAGDPIVGYQHRYVARWWPLGVWGANGSIPQIVSDGQTYTQTYSFTLPNDYIQERVYIFGVVQEYTSNINERPIFNVVREKLDLSTTSKVNTLSFESLEIYPNPANELATVSFYLPSKDIVNIQMIDLTGKTIFKESYEMLQGAQEIDINTMNIPNGTYLVNITNSNNSFSKKLIINH